MRFPLWSCVCLYSNVQNQRMWRWWCVYIAQPCIPTILYTYVRDQKPVCKHPSLLCNSTFLKHISTFSLPFVAATCYMHYMLWCIFTSAPWGEKQHRKEKMRSLTNEQPKWKRSQVEQCNVACVFAFKMRERYRQMICSEYRTDHNSDVITVCMGVSIRFRHTCLDCLIKCVCRRKRKKKKDCVLPWHLRQKLAPCSPRPYSLSHCNCQRNSNYKRAHRPDSICF